MNKTLFQVLFSISILLMLIDLTKSSSINNSSVVSNNTNNFDSFNGTKTSFSGEKDDTPSTIQIEGKYIFVRLLCQIRQIILIDCKIKYHN